MGRHCIAFWGVISSKNFSQGKQVEYEIPLHYNAWLETHNFPVGPLFSTQNMLFICPESDQLLKLYAEENRSDKRLTSFNQSTSFWSCQSSQWVNSPIDMWNATMILKYWSKGKGKGNQRTWNLVLCICNVLLNHLTSVVYLIRATSYC